MACLHKEALLTVSTHAREAGFVPRTFKQIASAGGLSEAEAQVLPGSACYPQPLVVPGDELAWDPKYPAQSLAAAKRCMNEINRHTGGRHVIYIAAPPVIDGKSPKGMKNWSKLRLPKAQRTNLLQTSTPRTEDVIGYISAFFHGLPVKVLEERLHFATWSDGQETSKVKNGTSFPSAVALETSKEAIRVRCRELQSGLSVAQLNLNDLLDVAIAILPEDAYALLMLIEQDIYEDEDDDYCCGRAYGGSRIACVSAFRYHPAADVEQDVDIEHAWPASHCAEYVERLCRDETAAEPPMKKFKDHDGSATDSRGPLFSAMDVYPKNLDAMTLEAFAGLWLGRFCRTASHELGHCFGIDHCVYYACAMQGTASGPEDARQPPYLCPIDLAKVLHTTSASEREHHTALLNYCSKFNDQAGALFWKPFATWLKGRLDIRAT